jgi:hypothetical protein
MVGNAVVFNGQVIFSSSWRVMARFEGVVMAKE